MATVSLDDVNKVYENGFQAIHDLSLDIAGQRVPRPRRTVRLREVDRPADGAGLESITSGELMIDDRVVNDVEPKDRDIAMVFQNYALYPHMTVYDNIGFALKLARVSAGRSSTAGCARRRAILELEPYLDRKPGQLSGGQRQRVAMGRAIVRQPKAFLMDEPLSNLDAKLRVQMRAEIARLQRELAVTTIYVTHDQVEAMTMGDRVAVLKDGYLQQVDTPQNLYDLPTNVFVAAFIGSPSMNLYEGRRRRSTATAASRSAIKRLGPRTREVSKAPGAAELRRQAGRGRHPPGGLRGRRRRHRRSARPPPEGHRAAGRGARLRAHGALLDRTPSGSTPATRMRPRSSARASPTPLPASARDRTRPRRRGRRDRVATENLHFFDADSPQRHLVLSASG